MNTLLRLALVATLSGFSLVYGAAAHASADSPAVAPDAALARLLAGNQRFVAGTATHPHQSAAHRASLAEGQKPFAIVLTCADSRVAPELYFDQGLGDLFVLRNAGNVLDDHIVGSIEYAVEHLHVGLIVVVGHSKCGAVSAAVAGGHAPGHIHTIVDSIKPAVDAVKGQPGDPADLTVRAHARRVAEILGRLEPIVGAAVKAGHVKVVASRYELATGRIELLP
jgi:carbonic anhydrase